MQNLYRNKDVVEKAFEDIKNAGEYITLERKMAQLAEGVLNKAKASVVTFAGRMNIFKKAS